MERLTGEKLAELRSMYGEYEAADRLTELDDRWFTLLHDSFPSLAYSASEANRLAAENERLKREKAARIYYQDIVYTVCTALDKIEHRNVRHGQGIVCGTLETPTTEVQEAMARTGQAIDDLADLAQRLREIIGKLLPYCFSGCKAPLSLLNEAKKELET